MNRFLPAARLAELLAQLPPGSKVTPNSVGNLMVVDEHDEYIGYIGFTLGGELSTDEPTSEGDLDA
jgi:hypothetical protein